jgi:hypothetical protein
MARVTNPLLKGTSGSIGKNLVYRNLKNGTFSSKHPDMSGVTSSKNQTKGRKRFGEAVAYAKAVMKDPEKQAKIKNRKGSSVYHAALKEYLDRFSPDRILRFSLPPKAKAKLEALSLNKPQLLAVVYVSQYKKLSNSDYRNMNDVSKPTATRHLRGLADLHIIESNKGKGAGAHYIMGSWWKEIGSFR